MVSTEISAKGYFSNICVGIVQMMQALNETRTADCGTRRTQGTPRWGVGCQGEKGTGGRREGQQLGLSSFPLACLSHARKERVFPSPTRIPGVSLHVRKDELGVHWCPTTQQSHPEEVWWIPPHGTRALWEGSQVCRAGPWENSKVGKLTVVTCSHALPGNFRYPTFTGPRTTYRGTPPKPALAMHVFQIVLDPQPSLHLGFPICYVCRPAFLICKHILIKSLQGQMKSLLPLV